MSLYKAAVVWLALSATSTAVSADPIAPARPSEKLLPALDYSDPGSWAALGDAEGAAAAVAPGALPRRALRKVDVFYVYPTTDLSKDHYSQDMDDKTVRAWTDGSVVARQAGALNQCCRMFAPRYHQATLGGGDADLKQKAFAYAYSDVLRAFDYYLAHDNGGRPFILMGHSQGAGHVQKLLKDRVDGTPLQKRMVVAYVLGAGLTEGDFGHTYKSLHICGKPTQTGCVVQWEAVLSSFDKSRMIVPSHKSYIAKWGDDAGKTFVCINPLTFDRSRPKAPATEAKGAVPGAPDATPMLPLVSGAVGASCEDGLLVVTPSEALGLEPLGVASLSGAGSMHYHDVGLFYEDLRENADARAQAFLRQKSVTRR